MRSHHLICPLLLSSRHRWPTQCFTVSFLCRYAASPYSLSSAISKLEMLVNWLSQPRKYCAQSNSTCHALMLGSKLASSYLPALPSSQHIWPIQCCKVSFLCQYAALSPPCLTQIKVASYDLPAFGEGLLLRESCTPTHVAHRTLTLSPGKSCTTRSHHLICPLLPSSRSS